MAKITINTLLEAGVHFGHQTRRWNPKMKRFILTERNGIYIIDLQQTIADIDIAYSISVEADCRPRRHPALRRHQEAGPGSRGRARPSAVGMPYVCNRWLGGMLTNFVTIRSASSAWRRSRP